MMRLNHSFASLLAFGLCSAPALLEAAPFASNVQVSGTTVNFILNEPADVLSYSINGDAPILLDGSTKGQKTFSLTSPADTYSIVAEKNAAIGFTIPTGGTIEPDPMGRDSTQPAPAAGFSVISDDDSPLTRFFNQRGIDTSNNPNAPNFGTVYISVSNNATVDLGGGSTRTVTRGIYALGADGSDILGFGDNGQNPLTTDDGFPVFAEGQTNSPYRVHVADDGNLYVADWSDANGGLYRINPGLTSASFVLQDFGGPTTLPPGRNHGSIASAWVEGTLADGNLTIWTLDEDLTTAYVTGSGSTTDRFSMWRYDVGSGPLPHADLPTKLGPSIINGTQDLDRGADGKFYISQNRFAGTDAASIFVTDPDGTVIWDSLAASRDLFGEEAADVLNNSFGGVAVSPDQKWMATLQNFSNIMVVPLADGIPDLTGRMIIDTGEFINSGRGITFDAAGNIHYVSSGQARYRQLAPGGHTIATLSWDGSEFSFEVQSPSVGLQGDYNGDGKVDAADYILWRKNDGSQQGYDDWRTNFGATAPGSGSSLAAAAVPEPATCLTILTGVCLCLIVCRRRS